MKQGLNFTTAQWVDRYQLLVTGEKQSSSRTETDCVVSASHLPVGTPQQPCASDQRKITSLNIATALYSDEDRGSQSKILLEAIIFQGAVPTKRPSLCFSRVMVSFSATRSIFQLRIFPTYLHQPVEPT